MEERVYGVENFSKLYKAFAELHHEVALELNVSDSVLTILYTLARIGTGCRQRDISEWSSMSKQTINSSIRKLEKEEILYLGESRGRDKSVELTEKGRRYLRKNILPILKMEERAFALLKEEEQKTLITLAEKYLENLRHEVNGLKEE